MDVVTRDFIKNIVDKWEEFRGDNDDDWAYDMCYEFFGNLTRGEMMHIVEIFKQINIK